MQEECKVKLERDGSLVFHMPYEDKKVSKKVRTVKSDELNFYIPEKWDYEMEI